MFFLFRVWASCQPEAPPAHISPLHWNADSGFCSGVLRSAGGTPLHDRPRRHSNFILSDSNGKSFQSCLFSWEHARVSLLADIMAWRLDCSTTGLPTTPRKYYPTENKMIDFRDRTRDGISNLTSAADFFSPLFSGIFHRFQLLLSLCTLPLCPPGALPASEHPIACTVLSPC